MYYGPQPIEAARKRNVGIRRPTTGTFLSHLTFETSPQTERIGLFI